MLSNAQIDYLLADITGGMHGDERFVGSLGAVERIGLQVRDLQTGKFLDRSEGIVFLTNLRNELQALKEGSPSGSRFVHDDQYAHWHRFSNDTCPYCTDAQPLDKS